MSHIFVALSTFSEFDAGPLELLKASGVPYSVHSTGRRITRDELRRDAAQATVIIAGVEPYDEELLADLPELQCIVRCGVGVDAVDLEAARSKNITVLNTPDIPALAVAELAVSFYLSLSRNLRAQANSMGKRKWERLSAHLLSNRTVGIIGFGKIGRKIATLLQPFHVKIIVCDPFIDAGMAEQSRARLVTKEELITQADIISVHASKKGTEGFLLTREDFSKMKKDALFVNLARGGMIDEEGLYDALASGHLAGAGLDVFETEPYTGPLCELDNVILTPHAATLTVETRTAMEAQCVDKALRFLGGKLTADERVI